MSFDCNLDDFSEKSSQAIDYSDINELFDVNDEDEDKFKESLKVAISSSAPKIEEDDDYDKPNESEARVDSDGFKIPDKIGKRDSPALSSLLIANNDTNSNESKESIEQKQKKLDTPLAAMLPSKYADLDVTVLFPEFRPNQVLRFGRLFGPGKPSSLPQLWKNVKNRKRKKFSDLSKDKVNLISIFTHIEIN